MCCATSCWKILFFGINSVLVVAGASLCGLSLWATLDPNAKKNFDSFNNMIPASASSNSSSSSPLDPGAWFDAMVSASWGMVAIGLFVLVLGVVGCVGAWMENRVLLWVYCILLLAVMMAQIVVAVLLLVYRVNFHDNLGEYFEDYTSDKQLQKMQKSFKCCGTRPGAVVPRPLVACQATYNRSCFDVLWYFVNLFALLGGVLGMCLLAVELVALILCCCLMHAFNKEVEEDDECSLVCCSCN